MQTKAAPQLEIRVDSKAMPVGCFAPPMTDAALSKYEALAAGLSVGKWDIRDAMRECLAAVKFWWNLPESKGTDRDQKLELTHDGRPILVKVTTLTPDLVDKMSDAVPWPYELKAMGELFAKLDPAAEKELRDACHHLLWFATELSLNREPLTADKLPPTE